MGVGLGVVGEVAREEVTERVAREEEEVSLVSRLGFRLEAFVREGRERGIKLGAYFGHFVYVTGFGNHRLFRRDSLRPSESTHDSPSSSRCLAGLLLEISPKSLAYHSYVRSLPSRDSHLCFDSSTTRDETRRNADRDGSFVFVRRLLHDYTPFILPNQLKDTYRNHSANVKAVAFLGASGTRLISGSS